jgi:mannan endo-1,6-alpha-mannosidase
MIVSSTLSIASEMRFFQGRSSLVWLCTSALLIVNNIGTGLAYDLQPESKESIKDIAKQLAEDMLTFYRGDEPGFIPGVLPEPPYFCMSRKY